jgi:hypothetical protein
MPTIFGIIFVMLLFNLILGWLIASVIRKLRSGIVRLLLYCGAIFTLIVGDYALISFLVNALR